MNVVRRNKFERGESVIAYPKPATGTARVTPAGKHPPVRLKAEWIDKATLDQLGSEGTDTHRLCTTDDAWVERFGRDTLISFKKADARDRLILELYLWRTSLGVDVSRVFGRFLPRKNEEREKPQLLFGDEAENLQTIATENFLKYKIDFGAGYSVGLFIDQRENRRFVRQTRPKRLLNCFAYTCSFSVAAASVGAQTVSIDLSKKSLERGRENFALNSLSTADHRFIADDVLSVVPRLARKGEKFDMIILDPPTFSRSHRGKTFHVQSNFEELCAQALDLIERDGWILLSTNCSTLREKGLEVMGRYCLKLARRAGKFHRTPPLPDFPANTGASTIWLSLR
ncbi:MAG TPA: class I SAM-dependent methyltransferase [Chthoniobacterales bacterium]|nr:class I SAM-dependent methyltransferase [Chthoniobacterales bacterium]